MRKRREIEGISLSFLDVISCGFGALIILLVITKVFEPLNLSMSVEQLTAYLEELQRTVIELRQESNTLHREVVRREDTLTENQQKLTTLQQNMTDLKSKQNASLQNSYLANEIEKRLASARQKLTDEMKRLLAQYHKNAKDHTIGGIPVDSEYVIFIIDTSGSMFGNAWPLVLQKLQETLNVYPQLKGIQVMNDMGTYMFSDYAGRWIPDSPSRRAAIVRTLETWNVQSNSNPVRGIETAISTYYRPDRKISLYYFGDDCAGVCSAERVVQIVDRINRKDDKGNCRVRIHTVGFPVQFDYRNPEPTTGIQFAILMRALSERNCGTFVGLNSYLAM